MSNDSPQVFTHHCICSNFLLATTFALDKRRKLDQAYILPCPQNTRSLAAAQGVFAAENGSDDDSDGVETSQADVTVLTSAPSSMVAPTLVRSDEGIEKRYLLRCDRCKLVFAYQLDWNQYGEDSTKSGKRQDVLYLLDGATIETGDMQRG